MKKVVLVIFGCIELILSIPILIILLPISIIYSYLGLYSEVSMMISKIPLLLGEITRYIYYKLTLKRLGKFTRFKYGSAVLYRNAEIGDNVLVGYHSLIGECKIGDDVLIGSYVNILSGTNQHRYDNPLLKIREQKGYRVKIIIGNNIWIGNNCVIANNIADNCVIGVNSLVIKPINKSGVYIGAPARYMKNIYEQGV